MHRVLKAVRSWLATGKWRYRIALPVALLLASWATLWLAVTLTPLPSELNQTSSVSGEFTDRSGRSLRLLLEADGNFLRPIRFEDCPPIFIKATLSAEDKRFWSHNGVDLLGTIRAARDLLTRGRVVSGASTITQQLVKNVYPRSRTIRSKIIESLQAMKLERTWSKRKILSAYLNQIDYGNLCRGAGTAAWYYLGKPLDDVSAAEAAFLAALPNSPSRLNPHRYLERAKYRQRHVLARMHHNGLLSTTAWRRALIEPLALRLPQRPFAAPHFVDFIHQQRSLDDGAETTLDLELNETARRMLRNQLDLLADKNVSNGAAVVIENKTGDVLALVGSRNFFSPYAGQVNGAWAPRSAGSTFKPFTFLLALEAAAKPATVIADVPTTFATPTGIFAPQNYNHQYHGPINLRQALAASLNIPAVKILKRVGGPGVLREYLRDCGLTTLHETAGHYGLGLTIGNAETRLLELANAYACLARLGIHRPYRLLVTDHAPARRIFEHRAAWLIADILKDNDGRALAFGLHSPLKFDFPVACKTGTSSDFRDNWAIGYMPEFTVAVWMGNFDGSPMREVSGVTGAAPVMHELVEHLHRQRGTGWYQRPSGIVQHEVHPFTGRLHPQGRPEWFLAEHPPDSFIEQDFDIMGRLRLGREYAGWLGGPHDTLGKRAVLDEQATARPRLIFPLSGTVFYWDSNLPPDSQVISLQAKGVSARWSSTTLECFQEKGVFCARLKPGRHQLMADFSNQRLHTWILVEER